MWLGGVITYRNYDLGGEKLKPCPSRDPDLCLLPQRPHSRASNPTGDSGCFVRFLVPQIPLGDSRGVCDRLVKHAVELLGSTLTVEECKWGIYHIRSDPLAVFGRRILCARLAEGSTSRMETGGSFLHTSGFLPFCRSRIA